MTEIKTYFILFKFFLIKLNIQHILFLINTNVIIRDSLVRGYEIK